MSSQQSNNSNYKIDLSGLSPHYQPQVGNRMQVQTKLNLVSNLDLYIPRIRSGTTEDDIRYIFEKSRVGTVEYCDISLTRDKDSKKPQHFCAFVKLISWSSLSGANEDFARTKSIRIHLSHQTSEFWIILPNNNPIPRSHVNTSQLAAATDKLFEQSDALEKKTDKFEDEMRATIAEMRQMMILLQEKFDRLELEVAFLQKDAVTTVEEKAGEEKAEEERDYDAEVDALLDLPMPMMQGVGYARQMPSLPRNDVEIDEEEFFARPPPLLTRSVSVFQNKEDECIFSGTKPRRLVQAIPSVTLSLPEIVAKNPERAIESRDFCGNC
jgi:hypothetical protein